MSQEQPKPKSEKGPYNRLALLANGFLRENNFSGSGLFALLTSLSLTDSRKKLLPRLNWSLQLSKHLVGVW